LGSDLYLYADDSKLFRCSSEENDSTALQSDLNSLKDWFKKWLLRLNINTCNGISFGRNVINAHQYSVDDIDLEHVQHTKDLGITFNVKLNSSHLEYANAVWSPYKKCDICVLEVVQRRATKLINSIKHLTYENRLKQIPQSKR